jgi:Fe-S cluster assembly protein SufD
MAGLINNTLEMVKKQLAELPEWLQNKRQKASNQLAQLQEPNRKLEFWRYADAGRLTRSVNEYVTSDFQHSIAANDETSTLVIRLNESGFTLSTACPEWLVIKPIVEADQSQWVDVDFNQETVVNWVNLLMFDAGVMINVKDSSEDLSIVIEYDFTEQEQWQYVRNQITLPENSAVQITERHTAGRINAVNVFEVSDHAKLQRQQNILMNSAGQFVSFNQFEVATSAEIINMAQHSGGSLQHHLHRINFNGNHSKYTSGSINKSFDNNNITDIVEVNHHHKNNQSEVTHRSIAKDKSQIFNNAKALVAPGADQSEIEQDLKNVLLSEDAKIFSKPELEVYADEVVAAHGSTIGALDEQSLFYLQSRGIDIEQARDIMIESFEQEAVVC